MASILVVAGESSGDRHAAGLVRAYKEIDPTPRFFGTGGDALAGQGVEILHDISELSLVGVAEVLTSLPRVRRIFKRIVAECEARRPAAAVLVDSPDLNLRLAKALHKRGIPVLYYISPTVWAWRRGRLKTIKANVAKMLLIFPFERGVYEKAGVPAVYVGHPLIERLGPRPDREAFLRRHGLDPSRRIVTLLPGSRRSELRYHMPVLAEAAARLRDRCAVETVLVLADGLDEGDLEASLRDGGRAGLVVTRGPVSDALAVSDLALSSCGTATLEAALAGTPLVAFYRISGLTYAFGRPFVRAKHYCIVNILSGAAVVPELIQSDFTPDRLEAEARRLLESDDARTRMKAAFAAVRTGLGDEEASPRAARELSALIGRR